MSRDVIPLTIDDLSDFAKRLRASLQESDDIPGHLAFLGHISRAAGYQNYQHLKATNAKPVPLSDPAQPGQRPSDQPAPRALERALRSFDGTGVMSHWPKAYSAQALAMWAFWDALPGRVDLTESEVNDVLRARSSFGDHVLLRRSLIDHGMAKRSPDGRVYRRLEKAPPPEARSLIKTVRGRWDAAKAA